MTADDLRALVARFGVNAKLRRAVERDRGWRGDDWYQHWPSLAPQLVAAIAEVRGCGV